MGLKIVLCFTLMGMMKLSNSLNLDHIIPSSSSDAPDGWRGSMGPPIAPVSPIAPKARAFDDELLVPPAPVVLVPPPEGLYEVVVGRKSPLYQGLVRARQFLGSPDVITGTVMKDQEVAAPIQVKLQDPAVPPPQLDQKSAEEVDDDSSDEESGQNDDNDDDSRDSPDDRLEEAEASAQRDSSNYVLPPGSFYLPAVSKVPDEYFSETEKAIYIPLRRLDEPFQVNTRVVLVNKYDGSDAFNVLPSTAVLPNEGEGAPAPVSSEENGHVFLTPNEKIPPPPLTLPQQQQQQPLRPNSGPVDLVMTLYPNLPKLLPQPQQLKSAHASHGVAEGVSHSAIHEVKVVTPPHGYLPAGLKPQLRAPHEAVHGNGLVPPLNNQLSNQINEQQQQHLTPPGLHGLPAHVNAPPQAQKNKSVDYVSFTEEDISPLNFISRPPLLAKEEQVLQPQQLPEPPLRNFQNSDSTNKQLQQHHLVPSQTANIQGLSGVVTVGYGVSHSNPQITGEAISLHSNNQASYKHLRVPGDAGEVVVATKMGNLVDNRNHPVTVGPPSNETVEIVTGYFSESIENNNSPASQTSTDDRAQLQRDSVQIKGTISVVPDIDESPSSNSFHLKTQLRTPPEKVTHQREFSTTTTTAATSTTTPPQSREMVKPVDQFPHIAGPGQRNNPSISLPHFDSESFGSQTSSHGHESAQLNVVEQSVKLDEKEEASSPEGSAKPFYQKMRKISPKGAMYTVTQGHSKVKFFGFNALHGPSKEYFEGFQNKIEEPDLKFIPNVTVEPTNISPINVPKKSMPIMLKRKTIRPVYFSKRPTESNTDDSVSIPV